MRFYVVSLILTFIFASLNILEAAPLPLPNPYPLSQGTTTALMGLGGAGTLAGIGTSIHLGRELKGARTENAVLASQHVDSEQTIADLSTQLEGAQRELKEKGKTLDRVEGVLADLRGKTQREHPDTEPFPDEKSIPTGLLSSDRPEGSDIIGHIVCKLNSLIWGRLKRVKISSLGFRECGI